MKIGYRRLLLGLSAAALLLAAWLSVVSSRLGAEAEARYFEQYNRQQLLIANQTSHSIVELFSTFRRALSLSAGLYEGREVTRQSSLEIESSLKAVYSVIGDTPIIDLVIFDEKGVCVGIVPDEPLTLGSDYSWRGYYRWARDQGKPGMMYVSPFLKLQGGQNRGEMAVMVAEGIYDSSGRFKGVAMITINFDELVRREILTVRIGEQGYAWLIDSTNGTILVDPRGKIGGLTFEQAFLPKWPKLHRIAEDSRRGAEGLDWYEYDDPAGGDAPVRKLVAYAPVRIENFLWTVGVCTPEEEVKKSFSAYLGKQQSFFTTIITITVAGGGLFLALLFYLNRMLVREVADRTRALKAANEKLESTFGELFEAKKLAAVGRLALGLVHEVRNPLSSIRMNMQMIRKRLPPDGPSAENFKIMEDEIIRLNRLLGDVMSFARPTPPRLGETNLPDLVRRTLLLLRERFAAAGIEARDAWEEPFPLVRCDGEQLTQVMLNLLLNSIQALESVPGDRNVTLRGAIDGDFAVVSVSDTGKGVPEKHRSNVFDPFFTTKAQGGGLGLSIARRIAINHGGTLDIEPREGPGATFVLRLPLRGPTPTEAT